MQNYWETSSQNRTKYHSDNKIGNKLAQPEENAYLCTAKETDVRRIMPAAPSKRIGGGIEPPTDSAKESGACSGTACCLPCGQSAYRIRNSSQAKCQPSQDKDFGVTTILETKGKVSTRLGIRS